MNSRSIKGINIKYEIMKMLETLTGSREAQRKKYIKLCNFLNWMVKDIIERKKKNERLGEKFQCI